MDLIDLFEQRVAQLPSSAIALVTNAEALTYRELNQRANRIARHLRQLGVCPESRVALCLERSSDMLIAIIAVLKAGGAYVPLDPSWPAERSSWILQQTRCSVLISGKVPLPTLDQLHDQLHMERVDLQQHRSSLDAYPSDDLPRLAQPDNAAYVIYTSGSTGRPKGVVVTRANVARLFRSTEELFDFGPTDVWSMCHSYAFDYSVWEMWGAWLYGGKLVLVSRVEAQSPEQLYELLEREGVTVLSQTPSAFRALLQELQRVPSRSLDARIVVFGGEALDPSMLRDLRTRYPAKQLINMYGITETTVHSTYKRLLAEDMSAGRSAIGVELPDLRIHVLDDDLHEVKPGETGEIFIAGPGLARCYLDNGALTAERFLPELKGAHAGERMYRTGDLARRLPNAELEYLGRCDHQVKLRGYRIELGEIESSLRALRGVREAAVLLDAEAEQPRLVAYVFRDMQADLTAAALRDQLSERLPSYMVPAAFVILDAIPVTANGKLDRKALPKAGSERPEQKDTYVPPRTQLESAIAAIWAEALRIDAVGVRDNFFDLGGHSMLLIQVQERLREELGLHIPVVELFARPNISLLAEFAADESAAQIPLVARQGQGERSRVLRRRREARRAMPALEDGKVVSE